VLDQLLALPASDPLSGHLSTEQIAMSGHSFGGYTTMAVGGARYQIDALHTQCATSSTTDGFCSTLTPEKEDLFHAGFLAARSPSWRRCSKARAGSTRCSAERRRSPRASRRQRVERSEVLRSAHERRGGSDYTADALIVRPAVPTYPCTGDHARSRRGATR